MSIRLGIPRPALRLVHPSIQQSSRRLRPVCIRYLSVSTHERPSTVPPPSTSHSSSSLREIKRPETIPTPPAPPRNDTVLATSITSPAEQQSSILPSPTPRPKQQPKFAFKPLKAALTLSPRAVSQLKQILDQPSPKLVRVGVKNRGCAGLAYHLEYVDKPGKFDEIVEQDGTTSEE